MLSHNLKIIGLTTEQGVVRPEKLIKGSTSKRGCGVSKQTYTRPN